jgi:L-2-hydroxyglutarate oxidase
VSAPRYDVVVVGGGIVGLATAVALLRSFRVHVAVVEAEPQLGLHQTGRNSGVIHSGLYYKPGSRKALTCVAGRRDLLDFCARHEVPFEICGKLVVATEPGELPRLDELERRGHANQLAGLQRVAGERIVDFEPHARGLAALWVPETGIVDYTAVLHALARDLQQQGGELRVSSRVLAIDSHSDRLEVVTSSGTLTTGALINCAGLASDRVARAAGARLDARIVPFRGDYFDLRAERRHLLRNLIYPVPDPRFPFLGVHLTRRIDGSVEAGPNAVLALHRSGYRPPTFSLRDTFETLSFPGFWRLAARFWRIGARELLRAGSPTRFAAALQRFVPEIETSDLSAGGCGIRAQALDRAGNLLDDFVISESPRALHVLNAPSPAATASLAIAEELARLAQERFRLEARAGAAS